MSASVTWIGLKEFREKLTRLTTTLTLEAARVIHPTAVAMAADVQGQYPVDTGNLRSHVVVRAARVPRSGIVAYQVASTAKHAWIFEEGTKPRTARYRLGKLMRKPANRGFMPAGDILIKTAIRHRYQLNRRLIEIVESQGFEVRGGG